MITRIGNRNDISGIIALQRANLYDNLSPDQRKHGFVTTPFSESQLLELMAERGVFVAEEQGKSWAMPWPGRGVSFRSGPSSRSWFRGLGRSRYQESRFRRNEAFSTALSASTRRCEDQACFPYCSRKCGENSRHVSRSGITFINRVNERSYNAHTRKLGMTVIDTFDFSGRSYYMLSFDTSRPASERHKKKERIS